MAYQPLNESVSRRRGIMKVATIRRNVVVNARALL